MQTQLLPTSEQAALLEATMRAFNEAANWLAGEAFARKTANKILLQKLCYAELRERFGLSAQMAEEIRRAAARIYLSLPQEVKKQLMESHRQDVETIVGG